MSSNEVNVLQEKIHFYETILDNIYNGVMITDPYGKVIFFSLRNEILNERSEVQR
jgi:transcriptional regulator with PAS, ATPase and Fis domain